MVDSGFLVDGPHKLFITADPSDFVGFGSSAPSSRLIRDSRIRKHIAIVNAKSTF